MRLLLSFLILVSFAIGPAVANSFSQTTSSQSPQARLIGRWRVKFTLSGDIEKTLIFDAKSKGSGSFLFLDTGPNNEPVRDPLPAAWSELTNSRMSFSGEAELPLGTCCREIGTLVFKGKFSSSDAISGKLIFITSIDEEESAYNFHSFVGTFTATRLPNAP